MTDRPQINLLNTDKNLDRFEPFEFGYVSGGVTDDDTSNKKEVDDSKTEQDLKSVTNGVGVETKVKKSKSVQSKTNNFKKRKASKATKRRDRFSEEELLQMAKLASEARAKYKGQRLNPAVVYHPSKIDKPVQVV